MYMSAEGDHDEAVAKAKEDRARVLFAARQREVIEIDADTQDEESVKNERVMAITTARPSRSQSLNGSSNQEREAKQTEGGDEHEKPLLIRNASSSTPDPNPTTATAAVASQPDIVISRAMHSEKDDRETSHAVPHPAYETAYKAQRRSDHTFALKENEGSSNRLGEGKPAMREQITSQGRHSNDNRRESANTATHSGNDRQYVMHTDDNTRAYGRSSPLRPANRSNKAAGGPHSYGWNGVERAAGSAAIAASKELRAFLGAGGDQAHSVSPLYHHRNAADQISTENVPAFESYGRRKGGGKGEFPMPRRDQGAAPDDYFRSSYPYAFDGEEEEEEEEETRNGSFLHSSPLPAQHNYNYLNHHGPRDFRHRPILIDQSYATDSIEGEVAHLLAKEREQQASLSATRSRLGRLRQMIHEATAPHVAPPVGTGGSSMLKSDVPYGVRVGDDSMGHYDTSGRGEMRGREGWQASSRAVREESDSIASSVLHKFHPTRKSPEITFPASNASAAGPHVININVAAPTHPIASSASSLVTPPPPHVHHPRDPAYMYDANSSVRHHYHTFPLPAAPYLCSSCAPHPTSSTNHGGGGLRQQYHYQYQPLVGATERMNSQSQQHQVAGDMYYNYTDHTMATSHDGAQREQPCDVGAEARAFILNRQRMGLSVLARPNSATTAAPFTSYAPFSPNSNTTSPPAAAAAVNGRIGASPALTQRRAPSAASSAISSLNRVTSEARLPKGFIGVSTTPMGTVRHIASRIAAAREAMSLESVSSPSTQNNSSGERDEGGGSMLISSSSAPSPNLMCFTASPSGYPSATIEILPTGSRNGEWGGWDAGVDIDAGGGIGGRPLPLSHHELKTAVSPLFMRQTRAPNRSIGPFDTDALVEEVKAIARAREAREAQRRHQNAYSPAPHSSMF